MRAASIFSVKYCHIRKDTPCGFRFGYAVRCKLYVRWIVVNDQLDAQLFSIYLFSSLHVSSNLVLIIRRTNCINTTSGIYHSLSVTVSCAGQKGSSFPTCARNGHRQGLTYTRVCIDTIDSPDDEYDVARNMYRTEINTERRVLRQVGHLPWIITVCTVNNIYIYIYIKGQMQLKYRS
jgi:hypothetical protein